MASRKWGLESDRVEIDASVQTLAVQCVPWGARLFKKTKGNGTESHFFMYIFDELRTCLYISMFM